MRIGMRYCWLVLAAAISLTCPAQIGPSALKLTISNQAGFPIDVLWINTFASEPFPLQPQLEKPLLNKSKTFLITYRSHKFKFRVTPSHVEGGVPPGSEIDYIVGQRDTTVILTYKGNRLAVEEQTAFSESVESLKLAMDRCGHPRRDGYAECVAWPAFEKAQRWKTVQSETVGYYGAMVERFRNYTCDDDNTSSTEPVAVSQIRIGGAVVNVDILLDTSHAKIWSIDEIILEEECRILKEYGRPHLTRATVFDSKNGSFIVSDKRRAQQATYTISGDKDPLVNLYYRLFGVVNQITGYKLTPDGQQGFSIIQYNPSDEYRPHCDGDCAGGDFKEGGRVATAVCYCEVPTRGGFTTFSKANVVYKPKAGSAVFFSYLGPDGKMDRGLTEHSGCPVREGEKWLATMWFRKGVSAARPYNIFDGTGNLLSELSEYQELT